VAAEARCDGRYDCADRDDESGCRDGPAGVLGAVDLESLDVAEEEAEDAAGWAVAALLFGLPLCWLIKHVVVTRYAKCCGLQVEPDEEEGALDEEDDEDVRQVLEFIAAMVEHVEGDASLAENYDRLLLLLSKIHETEAWSDNARLIYDMGHLLFDSDMKLIDEFHVVMLELESGYFKGDLLEMNLCLKHDLGNRIVNELRWSTEPPGIRKLQMMLPDFFLNFLRTTLFKGFMTFLGLALETVSYYVDFVKDWIIFAILFRYVDK